MRHEDEFILIALISQRRGLAQGGFKKWKMRGGAVNERNIQVSDTWCQVDVYKVQVCKCIITGTYVYLCLHICKISLNGYSDKIGHYLR